MSLSVLLNRALPIRVHPVEPFRRDQGVRVPLAFPNRHLDKNRKEIQPVVGQEVSTPSAVHRVRGLHYELPALQAPEPFRKDIGGDSWLRG